MLMCMLAFGAFACRMPEEVPMGNPVESLVQLDFTTTVRGGYGASSTRSILAEETIETKVTQVTLASYDESGKLTDARYYDGAVHDMRLDISAKGRSNVYALVNMGDMTRTVPASESGMSGITYSVGSYESAENHGIPMKGILSGVTPGGFAREITVDRLFAKVCIRILHTSMENSSAGTPYAYNLKNISLYVRQANSVLSPFSSGGSRAERSSDVMEVSDYCGDMASREEYEGSLPASGLGPGPGYFQDTTFVFYVPENVQGQLLRGNADPLAKVESGIRNVGDKDYSGLCTYVEFNARRENTGQGYSGSVMYRFYLGEDDVSDFTVMGNCRYDLTLDLTENGLHLDNWKVTRGEDWTDTRVLTFMDDPYVVYLGGSRDVNVRYHRSSAIAGSERRPDDWTYQFDDAGMRAAGLKYTFNPEIAAGEDFCFSFSADKDSEVGAIFPLKVMTKDGSIVDQTVISIADAGKLEPVWDHLPVYVSQYGVLKVNGAASDGLPLNATVSNDGILGVERIDDDEFRIVAKAVGTVNLVLKSKDESQVLSVPIDVKAPVLKVSADRVSLNPDGASSNVGYTYVDEYGSVLQNVDDEVFMTSLKPKLTDNAFFSAETDRRYASLYVGRLSYESSDLTPGEEYGLYLEAVACPEVTRCPLAAYVTDPFAGIGVSDFGRLDDYTMFAVDGVNAKVRSHFEKELSGDFRLEFQAPVPDAEPSLVSASLVPSWQGSFTYSNEVYALSYVSSGASGDASFRVVRNAVTASTRHSAGKHDVVISVKNRHSGEHLDHVCGRMDVYVHAALGAKADFGSSQCSYSLIYNGKTFAEVYNSVAGQYVYNPGSTTRIYYMDVAMDWLVNVSGSRLLGGFAMSTSPEALAFISPGKEDGFMDTNLRLLYSVCQANDDRLGVGGEPAGTRAGIGRMLYRALRVQTYNYQLAEANLNEWFLGYTSATGQALQAYAPSYLLHDLSRGTDMNANVVYSRSPFYYSPPSFGSCVDLQGRGYHVIHFLEEIAPETGGWTNLL